jgi:hypothetical protein
MKVQVEVLREALNKLEVLLHEASGQIRHVLFRSGVAP